MKKIYILLIFFSLFLLISYFLPVNINEPDIYYHMNYYYDDTGNPDDPLHVHVSAWRSYYFTVLIDLVPTSYKHHISDLKTIHQSGYWVRYDSSSSNYASILNQGTIDSNDISAELMVHTDDTSYIILKNNLATKFPFNIDSADYQLDAKFKVISVEYTTALQQEIL